MGEYSEAFVAFDVAKRKHAVAVAESGRTGEVRFLGEIENGTGPIERTIRKLASRYHRLHVCFEAGPTGYGLYRQVRDLGHDCMVVAPALIPQRPGERVKTNRRDAVMLARLHRANELTGVWVPDAVHEAVRDLVRAREAAADDLRRKRQQLLSFLLRHGRIYSGGGHWTLAHRRWLARQSFEHAAQQIVFQEGIDAIEDALQRLRRLEKQLAVIVPSWSNGAGCGSVSGDARRLLPGRRDLCRRNRRCAPLREAATADVLPRPGPGGKLNRRHDAAEGPDARRQSARSPGAGRGCLDLSLSRQGQRNPDSPARGTAKKPCATSPGRRRSGCAPAIAGSALQARSCRWWWRRSPARWRPSCGPSDVRSRPCRRSRPPLPRCAAPGVEPRWGTHAASPSYS